MTESKPATKRQRSAKFNLKYFVYKFVLAPFVVVWAIGFLYIHSFNNLWGTRTDKSEENDFRLRQLTVNQVRNLEAMHTSPEELYSKRIELSQLYAANNDLKLAKKLLNKVNDELKVQPESEAVLRRRIDVETRLAHIMLDDSTYLEARDAIDRAQALATTYGEKFDKQKGAVMLAGLQNEQGVVSYIQANGTLDGKQRQASFNHSREIFQTLVKTIDGYLADDKQFDKTARGVLTSIKLHAQANLHQVDVDQSYEWMFLQT